MVVGAVDHGNVCLQSTQFLRNHQTAEPTSDTTTRGSPSIASSVTGTNPHFMRDSAIRAVSAMISTSPISNALYADAVPNAYDRSCARISIDIGRFPCVYSTILATNSPTAVTHASNAPATMPGRAAGNTTRRTAIHHDAPSPRAADSRDRSICRSEPSTACDTSGMLRTKYARGRIQNVPTRSILPAARSFVLKVASSPRATAVPGIAHGSATRVSSNLRPLNLRVTMRYAPATQNTRSAAVASTDMTMLFRIGVHSWLVVNRPA